MSLFFYLFTYAINLWHREFVTADIITAFSTHVRWHTVYTALHTQVLEDVPK